MAENSTYGLTDRALMRVQHFIDVNLGETITLAGMAGAACLSPCHFVRMFRRATGETPMHYLRRRRVDRAKLLLAEGELSISEIALETGFCDHSHLCRIFRQLTGMSPGKFRQYTEEIYGRMPGLLRSIPSRPHSPDPCDFTRLSERMIYSSRHRVIMAIR